MNQIVHPVFTNEPPPPDDPFHYGWRYVRRTRPNGEEEVDIVPLSFEDLLYPEEDDYVVNKPPHLRDFEYCHGSLETFYADQVRVVVLGDCRVDFNVKGLRPLGPDILVLFDVIQWLQEGTFRIAKEGGRSILAMEITSPSTYRHDVGAKIKLYYRAGVQIYVIIDRGPQGKAPARLRGFQRGPKEFVELPLDAQGRLDLSPVPLLLGLEDDHPWFYEIATARRLLDRTELAEALVEAESKATKAESKAKKAESKAKKAESKAEKAESKAKKEAAARAALEQRIRELESKLHRQSDSD